MYKSANPWVGNLKIFVKTSGRNDLPVKEKMWDTKLAKQRLKKKKFQKDFISLANSAEC